MKTIAGAKLCLKCNATVKGRADKKFCNDFCRAEYNNALKSGISSKMRSINNALGKNRRILNSLIRNGKTGKIKKEELVENGFHFKYITHTYINRRGLIYFFCYDLGYLALENDRFLIIKRNN